MNTAKNSLRRMTRSKRRYSLVALVRHLSTAKMWTELEHVLTDIQFLDGKAQAGLVSDLADDFALVARTMPEYIPFYRLTPLLEEAIRREGYFIARHPCALFQCLWNTCWWYDCPEASDHYDSPEDRWAEGEPPWRRDGPKLYRLLEKWREEKARQERRHTWLRAVRPPEIPLGSGLRASFPCEGSRVVATSVDDQDRITLLDRDGCISRWALPAGEFLFKRTICSHAIAGSSPDGGRYLVAVGAGRVSIFQMDDASATVSATMKEGMASYAVVTPDARLLAVACRTKHSLTAVRLRIVRLGTQVSLVREYWAERYIRPVKFLCGSTYLLIEADGYLKLVKTCGWRQAARFGLANDEGVIDACTDSRHRWLVLATGGSFSDRIRVLQLPSLRLLAEDALSNRAWGKYGDSLPLRGNNVQSIAVSPDRSTIGVVQGNAIRMYSFKCNRLCVGAVRHIDPYMVRSVHFSSSGEYVATIGSTATKIWLCSEIQRLCPKLKGHDERIAGFAFTPNGDRLVCGGIDGRVSQWCTSRGVELARCVEEAPLRDLRCTPPGDKLVCIWSSAGMSVRRLENGRRIVTRRKWKISEWAMDETGERLVFALESGEVYLLDIRLRRLSSKYVFRENNITSVAFSTRCGLLVTGHSDGTLVIREIRTKETVAILRGVPGAEVSQIAIDSAKRTVHGLFGNEWLSWRGPTFRRCRSTTPGQLTCDYQLTRKGREYVLTYEPTRRSVAWFPYVDEVARVRDNGKRTWAIAELRSEQFQIVTLEEE